MMPPKLAEALMGYGEDLRYRYTGGLTDSVRIERLARLAVFQRARFNTYYFADKTNEARNTS